MNRLRPGEDVRRFISRLVLIAVAIGLGVVIYRAAHLILLSFGAALGAILLSSIAAALTRRIPLSRPVALTAAVLLLLLTIILMGWLFGAETVRQADRLGQRLPQDWARVEAALDAGPVGHLLLESARQSGVNDFIARAAAVLGLGAVQVVVNFLILFVGAIFFAAQPRLYARGLAMLAPPAYRPLAAHLIGDIARTLRLWLRTQIISMVLMGVMIGLGLWWAGVDAPAALGLLGGLSEFIPYVGPTLAMVPAIIMALAGSGSLAGVLLTYLIVRIVQAHLITPLITRRLVSVPPGLYLFLILLAGYVFGTFGLFFSGALAVTAYTAVKELYARETLGDAVALPGED